MNVLNETPFTYAPFMGKVVYPKDTLTLIVKGTFKLFPDQPAQAFDPGEHLPPTGDLYYDDDPHTSVRYESDFVHFKPRTDVLVVGHCHVPEGGRQSACSARFKAGPIDKSLMIFGDRHWVRSKMGTRRMSEPELFNSMELRYENSFGGPDYSHNPVGKGIRSKLKGLKNTKDELPNIKVLVGQQLDTLREGAPAGFGPLGRTWSQRMALVGTYGKKWQNERWPWLPEDINWGCFNAAPFDQQIRGYLKGDEPLYFKNMHPVHANLNTSLPGLRVRCFVHERKQNKPIFREIKAQLDTLWVDMVDLNLVLVWRGLATVASKDCDQVEDILIVQEAVQDEARTHDYYQQLLIKRKAEATPDALQVGEEKTKDDIDFQAVDAEIAASAAKKAEKIEARFEPVMQKALADAHKMLDQSGLNPKLVSDLKAESDPERFLDKLYQGIEVDHQADRELKANAQKQFREMLGKHRPELEKVLAEKGYEPGAIDEVEAFTFKKKTSEDLSPPNADELAEAVRSGEDIAELEMSGANFSGMSLEGANFREAQLEGANFMHARLTGADFSQARLEGANFEGADLSSADLTGADLSRARLSGARLRQANLSEAVLTQANLTEADLSEAHLCRAQFGSALLTHSRMLRSDLALADFSDADLSRADLSQASLDYTVLESANLTQAVLTKASGEFVSLSESNLKQADFSHVCLEDSNFSGCRCDFTNFEAAVLNRSTFERAVGRQVNLKQTALNHLRAGEGVILPQSSFRRSSGARANWAGADLQESDFILADMPGCDFTAANLTGCDCRTAELKQSVFDRASLVNAKFNRANLFQARMQEASLSGANFKGCNLYGSEFLDATISDATNFSEANLKSTKLAELKV